MTRIVQNSSIPWTERSGTAIPTLLLTAVILLGGRERGAAQPFPAAGRDTTPSMGVFQIVVDPAFYPLMLPAGPLATYPGYNIPAGTLTSPLCIDSSTTIGHSSPNKRPYTFPVGGITVDAPPFDSISGYAAYPAIPAPWATAGSVDEVLTEIESFVLTSVGGSAGANCPPDPRLPSVPLAWPMVMAGTGAGVSPRSIGIVQQLPSSIPSDFPAQSFFDIFVDVSLPPVGGTESASAFPPTGALLYNDLPLIITNTNLTSFPPTVVYIHGESTAVPVKFKANNPPYWAAGDIFGYLALAGHGTVTNDCNNTGAVQSLLNATLGPIGSPAPGSPVEWLRTSALLPSSGSTYNSMTGSNFSGQTIDYITYPFPGGVLYARSIVVGPFTNLIVPPPYFGTNYYNPSNILGMMQLSVDGQNWSQAQFTGPMSVIISNTGPSGGTVSNYTTKLLQLNLTGTDPQFGIVMVRLDPNNTSTGQTTIRPDPRGYRISSFFDVFTDLSLDGGNTWNPANRSMRVEASAPPAAPNSIFPSISSNNIVLNWLGTTFTLQTAATVNGSFADIKGATNGYRIPIGNGQQYFRLRQ